MANARTVPDLDAPASRAALARVVTRLFNYWSLDQAEQLELLGLCARSTERLRRFHRGAAVRISRDTLDRIGWLLSIYKTLYVLYPYNERLRREWMKHRNLAFENHTPLEVIRDGGLIEIARIARHLQSRMER